MRAFGILGLLVVVAIIFVLWTNNTSQIAKTNKEVRPQIEQMAGVDESGQRVSDTYTLEPIVDAGRFKGMKVQTLTDDSMMKKFYGLQVGDLITECGGQGGLIWKAREEQDQEMMRAKIAEAYQYKAPITVMRNNASISLQPGAGMKKSAGTATAPPPPTKDDATNSVQGQLDKITKPR